MFSRAGEWKAHFGWQGENNGKHYVRVELDGTIASPHDTCADDGKAVAVTRGKRDATFSPSSASRHPGPHTPLAGGGRGDSTPRYSLRNWAHHVFRTLTFYRARRVRHFVQSSTFVFFVDLLTLGAFHPTYTKYYSTIAKFVEVK